MMPSSVPRSGSCEHKKNVAQRWPGYDGAKPRNLLQSLLLNQIQNLNRRFYCLESVIIQQIHRRRAIHNPCEAREGKCYKFKKVTLTGLEVNSRCEKRKTQHVSLTSGQFLRIAEERILWRRKENAKNYVIFSKLEPDVERTLATNFKVQTPNAGKFGEDWDIFYPDLNSCDSQLSSRPIIVVISLGGKRLDFYDNETGKLKGSMNIATTDGVRYKRVTSHENGLIVLESESSKLAQNIYEFLILKYPPLQIAARMQIDTSSVKKTKTPKRFEVVGDYLVGFCPPETIALYDLKNLMKENAVEGGVSTSTSVTHTVKMLPHPLVTFKSLHSHLAFYPGFLPAYCVTRIAQGYEVHEITPEGKLRSIDKEAINFSESVEGETRVSFLSEAPPRIISKGATSIRIFEIRRNDDNSSSAVPYLKLVFEFPRTEEDQAVEVEQPKGVQPVEESRRRSSRTQSKKSYCEYENFTLVYDENTFLQQLAIIRFAEKSFECFVYSTFDFTFLYKANVQHFSPKDSEIYDDIDVHFTPSFIAVRRKGSGSYAVYFVSLLRGLE